MSRKFLTAVDLAKNELQNAVVQNLASAPSAPVKGQLYYNSTGGDDTLYWWNGTMWVPATGGGALAPGPVTQESTFGATKNDGVAVTYARADHQHGNPTHVNADHAAINLSALAPPTANISMGGFKLTNVGTPTVGTDAVTKDYTDNLSAGLSYKDAVRVATTVNGTLASAFQNGAVVDGVTLATGNRILLKDQSTGTENGIYTVNASGAPTRATDADAVGELDGAFVVSMEGTANADKAWICSTNPPITPDTTATTWAYYGAGTAYSAGAGLTLTGSTFDVVAANGSLTVAADNIQVAYAGTGAAVTAARSDHNHDGTYTKKFAAAVGGATSAVVTHNLNSRDVAVDVYRSATPWDSVECDVERTDANNVTLRFAVAPAASEYRAVVVG